MHEPKRAVKSDATALPAGGGGGGAPGGGGVAVVAGSGGVGLRRWAIWPCVSRLPPQSSNKQGRGAAPGRCRAAGWWGGPGGAA
jgi:hypothetical protein